MKLWRKIVGLALVFVFVLTLPVFAKPNNGKLKNAKSKKKVERKVNKKAKSKAKLNKEQNKKEKNNTLKKNQNKKVKKKVKIDKEAKKNLQKKLKLEKKLQKQQPLEQTIDEQLLKHLQIIDKKIAKIQEKYEEISVDVEDSLEIQLPYLEDENETDIRQFKLIVKTSDGKYIYEYVVQEDNISAEIQKELKDLKENIQGKKAAKTIDELIKDISRDEEAEVIVERILTELEITDFDYVNVQISFADEEDIEITVGELNGDTEKNDDKADTKEENDVKEETTEKDKDVEEDKADDIETNGYIGKLNALHNRLDAVKNQLNSLEKKFGSDNEEIQLRYKKVKNMQNKIKDIIEN